MIVLDDFNGVEDMNLRFLLRLTDKYPMKLRVLYGVVEISAKKIVITSHSPIEGWGYPSDRIPKIRRRVVQERGLG